jgi:hypothetical protein
LPLIKKKHKSSYEDLSRDPSSKFHKSRKINPWKNPRIKHLQNLHESFCIKDQNALNDLENKDLK